MRGNLKDNQAKLDSYEKSIKAALERKRKAIMESKQIAYDMLSELYGLGGHELVDAVTAEHTQIGKLTDSGMSYAYIDGFVDSCKTVYSFSHIGIPADDVDMLRPADITYH